MKYIKMKAKIKKLWVKALLSGDYKQGDSQLVNENPFAEGNGLHYCCLGVLQDIGCKARGVKFKKSEYRLDSHNKKTSEWSGLDSALMGDSFEVVVRLQEMNDGAGEYSKPRSFKQIAKWIEHNL